MGQACKRGTLRCGVTCSPYADTCTPLPVDDASAEGGVLCSNLSGNSETSLGFGSYLEIHVGDVSALVLGNGVLGLFFGASQVTRQGDGSLLLDAPEGGDVTAICPGIVPRFASRSLRHRVVVRGVCDVGQPIVGSFEGTFLLSNGDTCEIDGQFAMTRTE